MANGKVASYRMETRMAIADALVNGRDYGEIREYLTDSGMATENLPSDHSLKTFQESVEYQTVYADRRAACDLKLEAGRVTGCASARVSVVQNRLLETLERWLDKDLLYPADMFKMFALTLQYQKQELMTAKVRADLGTPVLPEALGPQSFSMATMQTIMARLADDPDVTDIVAAADAVAADSMTEETGGSTSIPDDWQGGATTDTSNSPDMDAHATAQAFDRTELDSGESRGMHENITESARKSEESGAFLRIPADIAAANGEEDVALAMSTAAEVVNCHGGQAADGRSAATRGFRNAPSPEARKKARAKRRKRRK